MADRQGVGQGDAGVAETLATRVELMGVLAAMVLTRLEHISSQKVLLVQGGARGKTRGTIRTRTG